jgi:hypothetical protein
MIFRVRSITIRRSARQQETRIRRSDPVPGTAVYAESGHSKRLVP